MSHPAFRPLRSFGRRKSRPLRGRRRTLIDAVLPHLSIAPPEAGKPVDPVRWFGETVKSVRMEIGFGAGEHLAAQAARHPEIGFIGCEPYVNGVAGLLAEVERRSLENVRIFGDDARLLLPHLAPGSLDRIFILFPDPWPKKRHHKRRLICAATLALLAHVLRKGGLLRLTTDHAGYAAWMLQHLLACESFEWTAERAADWQRPPDGWAPTRYERKRVSGGAPVYLDFVRR